MYIFLHIKISDHHRITSVIDRVLSVLLHYIGKCDNLGSTSLHCYKKRISQIGDLHMSSKKEIAMKFPCDCCGLCCMNLNKSSLYRDLHNGDGICRHFDKTTKKCKIYDSRPDKCNIDVSYQKYFSNEMTKEEFYSLNIASCNKLKAENKRSQRE